MAGPWPHPKTGILYYRKASPPDIFAARMRLAELGVKVTREVQRSLGTKDRKPAERRYAEISAEVEAEWDRWRALLRDGLQALSPKQQIALAAEHASAFLAAHDEDPFAAPPETALPEPPEAGNAAWTALVKRLAPAERAALAGDLREFLRADEERKRSLAFRLLTKFPSLQNILGPDLAAGFEAMHGADTDAALSARNLHVDAATRRLVNFAMTGLMGATQRGLEARRGGDYRPVSELETAPSFVASTSSPSSAASGRRLSLEALLDHNAKTTSIRAKSVATKRSYLRKFSAFLGHDGDVTLI